MQIVTSSQNQTGGIITITRNAIATHIVDELRAAVGTDAVRTRPGELMAYAYDATGEKHTPDLLILPTTAEQVAACLRIAKKYNLPVLPRGASTNLSGGTLPINGGLVISLIRMTKIGPIDTLNRRAMVEPGVVNLNLNKALHPLGYHFAPDPSSMKVATIGGNVAENAGGLHCLKYGVTTGHVLSVQLATADGELIELGENDAYDLRGLVVGSEGTLGLVTRATVRITPMPAAAQTLLAVFADLDTACLTVAKIIAARLIPAVLELMDGQHLALTRESGLYAFPVGAEAALIIEVDGDAEDLDHEAYQVAEICREMGAVEVRLATDEAERNAIWIGRRSNYGIMARTSPYIWTQDVTVPRHKLPEMFREVIAIGKRHGQRILTVAHAGDGNMHPAMPFNPHDPVEKERIAKVDLEIIAACIRLGGSISGEHGIGIDKLAGMNLMFSADQLELMRKVRSAFDPEQRMNAGKLIPAPKGGY